MINLMIRKRAFFSFLKIQIRSFSSIDCKDAFKIDGQLLLKKSQDSYLKILKNYHLFPRKPTKQIIEFQSEFLTKFTKQSSFQECLNFIFRIKSYSFVTKQSIQLVKQKLQTHIQQNSAKILSKQTNISQNTLNSIKAAYAMLLLDSRQLFDKLKQNDFAASVNHPLESALLLYCDLIVNKHLTLSLDQSIIQQMLSASIISPFQWEHKCVKRYISIFKNSKQNTLNIKRQLNKITNPKSPLQLDIHCILKLIQAHFQTEYQLQIGNQRIGKVDLLIQKDSKYSVIEILGNHHYQTHESIKNQEIIRGCLINTVLPLKYVHYRDYNATKGLRNKIAYIKHLIELDHTNWQPMGKGFDSHWILDQQR